VYYVSEASAWISRLAPNLDTGAASGDQGSDLIEFNPSTMKRTARRVDLSSLNTSIEEQQYDAQGNPTAKVKSTAYARPAGLIPAGAFLAVGLVRATESYSYAPGVLAIVDPVAGKLHGTLALGGLSNCGELRPVLGQAKQVLVICIGAWGDAGASAGIVKVGVDDQGAAKVLERFDIAKHKGAANTNSNAVSIGPDLVVVIAPGALDSKTMKTTMQDAAFVVDLKTGKQTMVWQSTGAFSLGLPSYDADTGVLLIPDAGDAAKPTYGAQRLLVDPDTHAITHEAFVNIGPKTTLAAREVHLL
jgi:hypothetical protein